MKVLDPRGLEALLEALVAEYPQEAAKLMETAVDAASAALLAEEGAGAAERPGSN